MIPVEGHKNLFRDPETGAILDHDTNAYSQHISKRNRKLDEKAELDAMKKDIDEIKSLLQQLVNHKT